MIWIKNLFVLSETNCDFVFFYEKKNVFEANISLTVKIFFQYFEKVLSNNVI